MAKRTGVDMTQGRSMVQDVFGQDAHSSDTP